VFLYFCYARARVLVGYEVLAHVRIRPNGNSGLLAVLVAVLGVASFDVNEMSYNSIYDRLFGKCETMQKIREETRALMRCHIRDGTFHELGSANETVRRGTDVMRSMCQSLRQLLVRYMTRTSEWMSSSTAKARTQYINGVRQNGNHLAEIEMGMLARMCGRSIWLQQWHTTEPPLVLGDNKLDEPIKLSWQPLAIKDITVKRYAAHIDLSGNMSHTHTHTQFF
jgi:hypothetical protein